MISPNSVAHRSIPLQTIMVARQDSPGHLALHLHKVPHHCEGGRYEREPSVWRDMTTADIEHTREPPLDPERRCGGARVLEAGP